MLFVLSPAKSLDFERPTAPAVAALTTQPRFTARSAELIRTLASRSVGQIAELMGLSEDLARLNAGRYAQWSCEFTAHNSKPAVLAFAGAVYVGLDAGSLTLTQLRWAQDHLVILSGLHGALRPLDALQPYRLEMGTRLATDQGPDLYTFWGDAIASYLNERARADASPVIVNLASQEYFKAVQRRHGLAPRVVECVFEDWKDGRYRVIGFFAKRARGLMARHAVQRRIATPLGLRSFAAEGYRHDPSASDTDRLVFRRRLA
jgi:cytoplasmic iron level regulating protein YaaA (DUF328/UPF0246 family)